MWHSILHIHNTPKCLQISKLWVCYSHLRRYQQKSEYPGDQPGHWDFPEGHQCWMLLLEKALFAKQPFPRSTAARPWEDPQLCDHSWTQAFCELLPSGHRDTPATLLRNATGGIHMPLSPHPLESYISQGCSRGIRHSSSYFWLHIFSLKSIISFLFFFFFKWFK